LRRALFPSSVIVALLLLLGPVSVAVQAQKPCVVDAMHFYPYGDTSVQDLRLNALCGPDSGFNAGRIKADKPLRVVVTNVNPFLFRYSISVSDKIAAVEASPVTFFNLALKPLGVSLEPPPVPSTIIQKGGGGQSGVARADPKCAGKPAYAVVAGSVAQSEFADDKPLRDLVSALNTHAVQVRGDLQRIHMQYQGATTTLLDPTKDAGELFSKAKELAESVPPIDNDMALNLDTLEILVPGFSTEAKRLSDEAQAAQKSYPACEYFSEAIAAANSYLATGDKVNTLVTLGRQQQAQIEETIRYLLFTGQDSSRYYIMQIIPRYDTPTDLTISVSRSARAEVQALAVSMQQSSQQQSTQQQQASQPQQGAGADANGGKQSSGQTNDSKSPAPDTNVVITLREHLGGAVRYSIGIGIAGAWLAQTAFATVRRPTVPQARTPNDTSGLYIALQERSQPRVVPIATFDWLFHPGSRSDPYGGPHASFGVALRTQGPGTDLEYYLGLGWTFSDRFEFGAGAYVGRQQQLAPGFAVGSPVQSTDVPTRSITAAVLATIFTIRVY